MAYRKDGKLFTMTNHQNGILKHRRCISNPVMVSSRNHITNGNTVESAGFSEGDGLLIPTYSTDSLSNTAVSSLNNEFRHCVEGFETAAELKEETKTKDEEFESAISYVDVFTIGGYVTLQLFGYLRDFLRRWGFEKTLVAGEKGNEGFKPLYTNWEDFYTRNVYIRIRDCWNRPICSVPGKVSLVVVVWPVPQVYGSNYKFKDIRV